MFPCSDDCSLKFLDIEKLCFFWRSRDDGQPRKHQTEREEKEKKNRRTKKMRACTNNLAFVCAARRASTSYATTTTTSARRSSSRTPSSSSSSSCGRGRCKTSVRTLALSSSTSASAKATSSSSSTTTTTTAPLVSKNSNQNNNNNNNNGKRSSKVVANARKGMLFNSEMDDIRRDAKPAEPVKFTLPLSIKLYPSKCLRAENEPVTVFDDNLKELSKEMFKIMYETVGCGLAAPQVGVNYRLMVYNEAGAPGEGKEVVLVNPKISKFSKQKDFFEEGCLSFPKIYAEVEVRAMVVSSFLFSYM